MASSSMPTFSSSSFSAPQWKYDAFLSFRGEDTRKNIVDHIYETFCQKGIYTFKDDEKLERGKSIPPELLKAIEESRFAVIIFSKNYASSSWCLDELVKILECKTKMGQIVLPIFYDVDPSEVRKQRGSFEEAFVKYEVDFKEREKVQRWREALTEAANLSGWDLQNMANGQEAKLIKIVVKDILGKLGPKQLHVAKHEVGIDSRAKKIITLLNNGSKDVHFLGIYGIGGIGKTTIAKAVFNQIYDQFEGSCFLANVREEVSKQCGGLVSLQEKLLREILKEKYIEISNQHNGINVIKDRLRNIKVLVVLDDVDKMNQLDNVAGRHNWFCSGSRIIITTRDEQLLNVVGVNSRYNVQLLNNHEALQLFSWHAFGVKHPMKEYAKLSDRIVHYAGGLPLALEVIGCSLVRTDMAHWRSTVDRLKEIQGSDILEVLRISYDGLKDIEKEIFLDIACFFRGVEEDYVIRILDSCHLSPVGPVNVLKKKSLIYASNRCFEMHDLIQDMGQYIVCQEWPNDPGRRRRLWRPQDVCQVLKKNTVSEPKAVEGIMLNLPAFPPPEVVDFSPEALKEMTSLRLLILRNVNISKGPEYLPNKLCWLNWHGYPSKSMPTSFQAENLVGLEMVNSHIEQLWKGKKKLDKLKFINLSHSQKLTGTPDFTQAKNLEALILINCRNLVKVHPSVGNLTKLCLLYLSNCNSLRSLPEISENMEHLSKLYLDETAIKELPSSIGHLTSLKLMDLRNCKNLISLPSSICRLKCLKNLTLSGCSKLEKLPENLGDIECLEVLLVDGTAITQPPSSIVHLKNLEKLSFGRCQPLSSFFSCWRIREENISLVLPSLSSFSLLRRLDIQDCNLLHGVLPNGLGCLSSLEFLNLSGSNVINIPESINQLSRLDCLHLRGCKMLEALPELPSSIIGLYAQDCESLKSIVLSTKPKSTRWGYKFILNFTHSLKLLESDNWADMWLQCLLQGLYRFDTETYILLPGREIPEWFSHQSVGEHSISIQLPPHWWSENFMGFAACAVAEFTTRVGFSYRLKCTTHDHRNFCTNAEVYTVNYSGTLGSETLFMFYEPAYGYLKMLDSLKLESVKPNDVCQFEVSFSESFLGEDGKQKMRTFTPNKCGFGLVYKEDVKCNNQKMMMIESGELGVFDGDIDGSVAAVGTSSTRKRA